MADSKYTPRCKCTWAVGPDQCPLVQIFMNSNPDLNPKVLGINILVLDFYIYKIQNSIP